MEPTGKKPNAWIEFLRTHPMPGKSMKARVAEYKRRKRRTFVAASASVKDARDAKDAVFDFTKRKSKSKSERKEEEKPFFSSTANSRHSLGVHNLDPSTAVSLSAADVAAVRSPRGWISDNVLTGFQSLLAADFAKRRVVAMDCLQMSSFVSAAGGGGKGTSKSKNRPHVGHAHLVRYGLSPLAKDVPSMVVFPLHVAGAHWVVLAYEPAARRWTSWDSLGTDTDVLRPYVDACHARLKRFFSDNEAVVPRDGTYASYERKTGLPRQHDGNSCGLWACTYLYMLAKGYDRFDPYSQAVTDPAAFVSSVRQFLSGAIVTHAP